MRLLLPEAAPVTPEALVDAPRTAPAGRPWVLANMVASVDGATAIAGESRGLSGPADRRVFHALRAQADAIMAAAGTVRADRYGPARPDPAVQAARRERGRAPVPPVVVVTRGLDLPWDAPLFTEAAVPTVVVCPEDAPAGGRARAAAAGVLIARGRGEADLAAALGVLRRDGVQVLLCEGGPSLLARLAADGVLDELWLTLSPRLVAGDAARALRGPALDPPAAMAPAAAAEDDGFLFLRYLARRPAA